MKTPSIVLLAILVACVQSSGVDDFNRRAQLDELQWRLDETKRSADQAAHEARKVNKQLEEQRWQNREPLDLSKLPPATVEGQVRAARQRREADELAQAQREADRANAHWARQRELAAIEERNRIEQERNRIEAQKIEVSNREQTEAFNQRIAAFEHSKEFAVARYPQLSDADSDMVKLVEAIDKHWKEIEHPLYSSSDKPLILAEMAAMYLKIKASN